MKRHIHKKWETLQSRNVFVAAPWIRVAKQQVRLPDGRVVDDYHQIDLGDYAIVYAQTDDGRVIVERQYKHGIGKVTLVLPAGKIEPGECPLIAAQRELLEETGYRAEHWNALGKFGINGNYGCGNANIFTARGARPVAEANSGDLEEIEVVLMDPDELLKLIRDGGIDLLGTAAVVALATHATIGQGHPGETQVDWTPGAGTTQ